MLDGQHDNGDQQEESLDTSGYESVGTLTDNHEKLIVALPFSRRNEEQESARRTSFSVQIRQSQKLKKQKKRARLKTDQRRKQRMRKTTKLPQHPQKLIYRAGHRQIK